jgi:cytidylate kinase
MQNSQVYSKVVAIDGPCGGGKSSLARKLAQKLNMTYIDTGAMYRALAYWARNLQISFNDVGQIVVMLKSVNLVYGQSEESLIEINGENLTEKIRLHEVSGWASEISKINEVRNYLVDFQRRLGKQTFCVMEGRDIGSIVFPDAYCKIYLTATIEERARRRLQQLTPHNSGLTLEQVMMDVKKRDEADINRPVAPLIKAEDAVVLDTTNISEEEVLLKLAELVSIAQKKLKA